MDIISIFISDDFSFDFLSDFDIISIKTIIKSYYKSIIKYMKMLSKSFTNQKSLELIRKNGHRGLRSRKGGRQDPIYDY
jgi:hypothetical protein